VPLIHLAIVPEVLVAGHTTTQDLPFLPSGGRNHCQYSLHLSTEGWLGWMAGINTLIVVDSQRSLILRRTGLDVAILCWR